MLTDRYWGKELQWTHAALVTMIKRNKMIWMCEVWICCLLIICVTTLTLQMHFFWYRVHTLIELLWLELLSEKFASCYQSVILYLTKDYYKYFPFWVWTSLLPITLWFKGLWSQGLISEVINIGVCSIKAKADDIHRSHTIDLAIFREKVISDRNSYGLSMTLSCNQVHN